MRDLFEKATREKYRFNYGRGQMSVEDLWDLPLTKGGNILYGLNEIAIDLDNQINLAGQKTFLSKTTKNPEVEKQKTMLEIVKHVISVKEREEEEARTRAARRAQKRQEREVILAALEQKRHANILSMPEEELLKRLEEVEED